MLDPMLRRALAFALLFALAPLSSELIELGVHYLSHGDFAHAAGHAQSASDEHGCTTLFHVCGCHTTSATSAVRTRLVVAQGVRGPSFVPQRPSHGRDQDPPPHLPPLA